MAEFQTLRNSNITLDTVLVTRNVPRKTKIICTVCRPLPSPTH